MRPKPNLVAQPLKESVGTPSILKELLGPPRFLSPDGSATRIHLRLLADALHRSPAPMRYALVWLFNKLSIRNRLPEMVVQYGQGMRFCIRRSDQMYSNIFTEGAWAPAESAVVGAVLRPGDFVIDAGANYGWFTILMARIVGNSGKVWSFEPVPPFAEELATNVRLNGSTNSEIFRSGLGARAGDIEIHVFDGLPHGHASALTLDRDDYRSYQVRVHALDDLVAERKQPSPALIKLDVEGFEREVIRGSEQLVSSAEPPIWAIEANYETAAALKYEPYELIATLKELARYSSYGVSYHPRSRRTQLIPLEHPSDIQHGSTMLCIPESRLDRLARLAE